jgi:YfiH family protein
MDARMAIEFVTTGWPAPSNVRAMTTTRIGGVSEGPFASLNLGNHVGDDPLRVEINRRRVAEALGLPCEPLWLQQVHGTKVVDAATAACVATADGAYATRPGAVCAVLTADCVPVFLCRADGTGVALLHAGWKGLAAGVIEAGVRALGDGTSFLAWAGPGIGPSAFEVGTDVKATLAAGLEDSEACFRAAGAADRWHADLYALVGLYLRRAGVIRYGYDAQDCTHTQAGRFFSYRRDGVCGRMASFIWME